MSGPNAEPLFILHPPGAVGRLGWRPGKVWQLATSTLGHSYGGSVMGGYATGIQIWDVREPNLPLAKIDTIHGSSGDRSGSAGVGGGSGGGGGVISKAAAGGETVSSPTPATPTELVAPSSPKVG